MGEAQLDTDCLAPCGINCLLCYKHLCAKPCPGCRRDGNGKPEHCKRCRIKACAFAQGYAHCHECPSFPCRLLSALDRRYRARYGVSPRDDGLAMRADGVAAFLRGQLRRHTCVSCGGLVCIHTRVCAACGMMADSVRQEEQAMIWNECFPRDTQPTAADIRTFIASPLWERFCGAVERTYGVQPVIEHSRCSGAPGWNVKYKKGGRSLCTLYPAAGYFTCLATIGGEAATEAELGLDAYGSRIATLYRNAKPMNGARWLMIDVRDEETLTGTLALVALRAARR